MRIFSNTHMTRDCETRDLELVPRPEVPCPESKKLKFNLEP